jgi:hypothetical protein
MTRVQAVLLLVLLVGVVYALMYAGWRRRARRFPSAAVATTAGATGSAADTSDTPDTAEVAAEGTYVSTTTVASRLERVAAAGLGVRARATMTVGGGEVRWVREGAGDVHVLFDWLTGVSRERGMAGKWVGQNRLVVVTWRAGDGEEFATGFLPRHTAEVDELVAAVGRHVPSTGSTSTSPQGTTASSSTPHPSDGDQ